MQAPTRAGEGSASRTVPARGTAARRGEAGRGARRKSGADSLAGEVGRLARRLEPGPPRRSRPPGGDGCLGVDPPEPQVRRMKDSKRHPLARRGRRSTCPRIPTLRRLTPPTSHRRRISFQHKPRATRSGFVPALHKYARSLRHLGLGSPRSRGARSDRGEGWTSSTPDAGGVDRDYSGCSARLGLGDRRGVGGSPDLRSVATFERGAFECLDSTGNLIGRCQLGHCK